MHHTIGRRLAAMAACVAFGVPQAVGADPAQSVAAGIHDALESILGPELAAQIAQQDGTEPAPKCYRKVKVEAVYETSQRLLRKARLVHDEAENGQITLTHFPAIYVEDKTLVSPEYVLLQEVRCTKRVLRKAQSLPPEASCEPTRGCVEIDPSRKD